MTNITNYWQRRSTRRKGLTRVNASNLQYAPSIFMKMSRLENHDTPDSFGEAKIARIGYALRQYIGRRVWLFRFVIGFIRGKTSTIVSKRTALVVEGFPRSANTFVSALVVLKVGDRYVIARHHHAEAQITLAVRLGKPVLKPVLDSA